MTGSVWTGGQTATENDWEKPQIRKKHDRKKHDRVFPTTFFPVVFHSQEINPTHQTRALTDLHISVPSAEPIPNSIDMPQRPQVKHSQDVSIHIMIAMNFY